MCSYYGLRDTHTHAPNKAESKTGSTKSGLKRIPQKTWLWGTRPPLPVIFLMWCTISLDGVTFQRLSPSGRAHGHTMHDNRSPTAHTHSLSPPLLNWARSQLPAFGNIQMRVNTQYPRSGQGRAAPQRLRSLQFCG